jgi:hypothetical protein
MVLRTYIIEKANKFYMKITGISTLAFYFFPKIGHITIMKKLPVQAAQNQPSG